MTSILLFGDNGVVSVHGNCHLDHLLNSSVTIFPRLFPSCGGLKDVVAAFGIDLAFLLVNIADDEKSSFRL